MTSMLSKPMSFETFTDKDLFACKLEGTIPYFSNVQRKDRIKIAKKMFEETSVRMFACEWYLADLNRVDIVYQHGVRAGVQGTQGVEEIWSGDKDDCWTLFQDISELKNAQFYSYKAVFIATININEDKQIDLTRIRNA